MSVELDKKQKDRLIKAITINSIGVVILTGIIFGYTLPTYEEVDTKTATAVEAKKAYDDLRLQGVTAPEYNKLLSLYASVKPRPGQSKEEIASINAALKKTGSQPDYLSWVNDELGKQSEYEAEIAKNNKIIGDIIPTYTEITENLDDDFSKTRLTLTDLVKYVEEELLIAHSLESTSPIGFGAITFNGKTNPVSNIGTYGLTLDVAGKNKNLKALIDKIQNSGNLVIKDGKIQAPTVDTINQSKKFSNLLINIKSAILQSDLDSNPDKQSNISLSLTLYVRARNLSDLVALKEQLAQKSDTLKKNVESYSSKCDTPGAQHCTKENYYRAVQSLKANFQEVGEVAKRISDSKKASSSANLDVQVEFDNVLKLYRDYSAIEATVSKHIAVIEATNKAQTQN